MEPLIISNKITVVASKTDVWEALTNPNLTKSYMYNCEAISTWELGDALIWKGAEDGVVYVKGHVTAFDVEQKLGFTVFDPNQSGYPDIPKNYLETVYTLEAQGENTLISVTQGDYSKADDGIKRYEHSLSEGGWDHTLQALKKLLESDTK